MGGRRIVSAVDSAGESREDRKGGVWSMRACEVVFGYNSVLHGLDEECELYILKGFSIGMGNGVG